MGEYAVDQDDRKFEKRAVEAKGKNNKRMCSSRSHFPCICIDDSFVIHLRTKLTDQY